MIVHAAEEETSEDQADLVLKTRFCYFAIILIQGLSLGRPGVCGRCFMWRADPLQSSFELLLS